MSALIDLESLAPVENRLRRAYLRLSEASIAPSDRASSPILMPPPDPTELVRQTALLLELLLASVCFRDILAETGGSVLAPPKDIFERVKSNCGIDMFRLRQESKDMEIWDAPPQTIEVPMDAVLRVTRSLLASCPMGHLERLANVTGNDHWWRRCRAAFDGLQRFVLKHDIRKWEVVGRVYQTGALEVGDVAAILEVEPSEAVWLLDFYGFSRPLEAITLDDETRAARLKEIREDRLKRNGRPVFSHSELVRDVLSSERIEGVDARKWIPPLGP